MAHVLQQIKGTKETTAGHVAGTSGSGPRGFSVPAPVDITSSMRASDGENGAGQGQTNNNGAMHPASSASASSVATFLCDAADNTNAPTAKYVKTKLVGRGAFGEAWLVKEQGSNASQEPFISKILNLPSMTTRQKQYAYSEIKCLASCHHPNIIRYVEDFDDGEVLCIIMEFADSGDLDKHIKQRAADRSPFQEVEVLLMFLQLCLAMDHIHKGRMMHRDVKTANIMLSSSGLLKIADFGFSRKYDDTVSGALGHTLCGTPYYLAPEIWRKQRYSKKADIWSLGVVLYEMMCLRRPFVAKSLRELADNVMAGQYAGPPEALYSQELRNVLRLLLEVDPTKRPNMTTVFRIPFIRDGLKVLCQAVKANTRIKEDVQKEIFAHVAQIEADNEKGAPVPVPKTVGPSGVCMDVFHEGFIMKYSLGEGRVWRQRHLTLTQGELHIRETPADVKFKRLQVERIQSVCPLPVRTVRRDGAFSINVEGGQATWVQAPNPTDMFTWIQKIQEAMGISE
eukprot:PhM_4_TR5491/c0_g1_i1/m.1020/K08857/NEK1_4_5; NIMA (never in mitosis gene a)-related kinase 1/4/5